jgi:anti-anti-sigma factor
MTISSRTPEGTPHHCPVCGSEVKIAASDPVGDAPCPRCGHLLWFDLIPSDDALVIALRGDGTFDPEGLDRIRELAQKRGLKRVILDFRRVRMLTSDQLANLVGLKKRIGPGGKLEVRSLDPDLREVFRITRLDDVFKIVEPRF